MKHKEIEISIFKKDIDPFIAKPASSLEVFHLNIDDSVPDNWIKAKLIIPVEPEVVEFESVAKRLLKLEAGSGNSAVCVYPSEEINDKLAGRRWKCKFEEIV